MTKIQLSDIVQSSQPIRSSYDEDEMQRLVQSIQHYGVIQPIKVRPNGHGTYELVDGHRRVIASRKAGMNEIEAFIEDVDDQTALIQGLIANVLREEMSIPDTAAAVYAVNTVYRDERTTATALSMDNAEVHRYISLHGDTPEIKALFADHGQQKALTLRTHAQVAPIVKDDDDRFAVLQKAQDESLGRDKARKVAEAIQAAADDEEIKDDLLKKKYDPKVHNAKAVADKIAEKREPVKPKNGKKPLTPEEEWMKYPDAATMLKYVEYWDQVLTDFQGAALVGKLSPEAVRFMVHKLEAIARRIHDWAADLEAAS